MLPLPMRVCQTILPVLIGIERVHHSRLLSRDQNLLAFARVEQHGGGTEVHVRRRDWRDNYRRPRAGRNPN